MFLFTLALEMGKTVSELLGAADSRELSEWMAFFKVRAARAEGVQAAAASTSLQQQAKADLKKRMG